MPLCRSKTLVTETSSGGFATPLYCRSWGCTVCQPKRQTQLIAKAISGNPNRFITVTHYHSTKISPNTAAEELANAWRNVVKRWKRLHPGETPQYFAVFEATKRDWPHLHILWRGAWLDQKWLSQQMAELIASPICWINQVTNAKQAARYVAKYCGKAPHKFGNSKRYWCTRDWNATPTTVAWKARRKNAIWRILDYDINTLFYDWTAEGLNPQVQPDWSITWGEPP